MKIKMIVLLVLVLVLVPGAVSQSENPYGEFQPLEKSYLYDLIALYHPNPRLVGALIEVESKWNHLAVSKRGAIGLMQVLPLSGMWHAGFSREELFRPEKNIIAGCKILLAYQRTSPSLRMALIKYSGGAEGYYEKVMSQM